MNDKTLNLPRAEIKKRLKTALDKLKVNDKTLFEINAHEDSLNGKLQGYLQKLFPDCDVDHNYNRYLDQNKLIDNEAGPKEILPDIIVHERKHPKNLLAIEVKKHSPKNRAALKLKDKSEDINKLKALHTQKKYLYRHAAFILLLIDEKDYNVEWID